MTQSKNVLVIAGRPPTDHPFSIITEAVKAHAALGRLCYQKFTCAGCSQRLSMEEPNVLYETGTCDKCGHVTDIKKQGCNYRLEISRPSDADVAEMLGKGGRHD